MQGETQTSAARQSQEPEESQPNQRQLQVRSHYEQLCDHEPMYINTNAAIDDFISL